MTLVRRFLVVQALLLWQGGFLFYAAVVVPAGTAELGAFDQGRVTRHVTDRMNAIGAVAVLILAWDQFAAGRSWRRTRWGLWAVLAGGLIALAAIHPQIEMHVQFADGGQFTDYRQFYFWHRVYLYVATVQWVAGVAYVAVALRVWTAPTTPVPSA